MLLKLHFKTLFFWHSIFLSAKHVNFLHIQTAAFAPLSWVFYANSELFRIFAFFGFCVASNNCSRRHRATAIIEAIPIVIVFFIFIKISPLNYSINTKKYQCKSFVFKQFRKPAQIESCNIVKYFSSALESPSLSSYIVFSAWHCATINRNGLIIRTVIDLCDCFKTVCTAA